jgi:hypothetical protein
MTDVFDCDQTPLRSSERPLVDRRKGWHTPDDCFKLLDVQKTMDSIFGKLADGDVRMGCIEDNIAGNHRMVTEDIKSIEAKLDENTAATNELLEIIQMGESFFKGVAWTGKWLRRIVMWVVPPVAAVVGLWQTLRPPK